MALLEIRGLQAAYGASRVLFGINLAVEHGEVVVLLGRNGAGKTTSLKSIMGVLIPIGGSVQFRGEEIAGYESDAIARRGIGYVPEDCRIFKGLSVRENLGVARRPARNGAAPWNEERVFELFPDLRHHLHRRGDALSGGQQRMLAISRTLMGNPDLILLDEPSEGLAPIVVGQMLQRLKILRDMKMTILLSEQNLRFALTLASRAYIIEKGEIRYEGSPKALAADEAVRRAYLTV